MLSDSCFDPWVLENGVIQYLGHESVRRMVQLARQAVWSACLTPGATWWVKVESRPPASLCHVVSTRSLDIKFMVESAFFKIAIDAQFKKIRLDPDTLAHNGYLRYFVTHLVANS